LVGLWSRTGEVEDFEERLTKAFDVQIVTILTEAVQRLTGDTETEAEAALPASVVGLPGR
jgi:vacuolar-type H+-ATPase subunit F/Vma7